MKTIIQIILLIEIISMIPAAIYLYHLYHRMRRATSSDAGGAEVSTPCKNHDNCETSDLYAFEHVPVMNGGHTTVLVSRCVKCGETIPFGSNIELVTPEAIQDIKKILQAAGWKTGLI